MRCVRLYTHFDANVEFFYHYETKNQGRGHMRLLLQAIKNAAVSHGAPTYCCVDHSVAWPRQFHQLDQYTGAPDFDLAVINVLIRTPFFGSDQTNGITIFLATDIDAMVNCNGATSFQLNVFWLNLVDTTHNLGALRNTLFEGATEVRLYRYIYATGEGALWDLELIASVRYTSEGASLTGNDEPLGWNWSSTCNKSL